MGDSHGAEPSVWSRRPPRRLGQPTPRLAIKHCQCPLWVKGRPNAEERERSAIGREADSIMSGQRGYPRRGRNRTHKRGSSLRESHPIQELDGEDFGRLGQDAPALLHITERSPTRAAQIFGLSWWPL